jgi:cytochrome b561
MQWVNSNARYGAVSQLLHWLTAVLVITAWVIGQLHDSLPKGAAHNNAMFIHFSFGLTVLIFLFARLAWRIYSPPPPPEPTRFGRPLAWASKIVMAAIYVLMLLIPIVGIVVVFSHGNPLRIYGLWSIPSPWTLDRAFAHTVEERHEFLANLLMILVVLHAAAAIVHHRVFRDRTLSRMLPWSR